MKTILFLTVLVTLSSTAGAIQCERCIDPNDPNCMFIENVDCPTLSMCMTAYATVSNGIPRIFRNCTVPEVCPTTGTHVISANLGPSYSYATVSCCNTDNCNNDVLTFPTLPDFNNETCQGCDPSTSSCDQIVNCRGEEDTCIEAPVVSFGVPSTLSGCGSTNICEATMFMDFLPFLEFLGSIFLDPTCLSAIPTTTTPMPTTTTPMTTTTTPMPTTTTPMPTTTTAAATTTESPDESTAPPHPYNLTDAHEVLHKILNASKSSLYHLYLASNKLKELVSHQHATHLTQLHQHLLDYQKSLFSQQCDLPFYHQHQLPLLYQQNMILNHHQLLLHQLHQHIPKDQCVDELSQQQLLVQQLQQQLQQYQILLMAYSCHHPDHIYYPHMIHQMPFSMPYLYPTYP
ncbi:protein psiD-like [Gouania willdenowi]|uniref:protein psiD-like n=1 Tax=Gouania willdenowi TaxID=441366 RepID=UPI0010552232|nr:protein psiD-like [Gouania willdenowi]